MRRPVRHEGHLVVRRVDVLADGLAVAVQLLPADLAVVGGPRGDDDVWRAIQ